MLLINTGIFFSINEKLKNVSDKKRSFPIEEIRIYTKQSETTSFWKAKFVKIMKTKNNQIERSFLQTSETSKYIQKNTEQIRSLKFFIILHVKVKISYIHFNVEYTNFNTLEKMRLLLTSAWTTIKRCQIRKSNISL